MNISEHFLDNLKNTPRRYLIRICSENGIKWDYTSDNKKLVELIKKHFKDDSPSQSSTKWGKFFSILFFVSLSFALFLSIVIIMLRLFLPKKAKFCDSHLSNSTAILNCIPCPLFASCFNGTCECDINYKLINKRCIFNDEDKELVSKMIDNSFDILKKRSGAFYCQKALTDWMSTEELEEILLNKSNLDKSKFNTTYKKVLAYLNRDSNILSRKINNISAFISIEMKVNSICKIRRYFYHKINVFSMISISMIVLVLFLFILQKKKNDQQVAYSYSRYLVEQLKKKRGIHQSKNQLIYNLNGVSRGNGNRVWPLVEKQLRKTHNVQCFDDGLSRNYRFIE